MRRTLTGEHVDRSLSIHLVVYANTLHTSQCSRFTLISAAWIHEPMQWQLVSYRAVKVYVDVYWSTCIRVCANVCSRCFRVSCQCECMYVYLYIYIYSFMQYAQIWQCISFTQGLSGLVQNPVFVQNIRNQSPIAKVASSHARDNSGH